MKLDPDKNYCVFAHVEADGTTHISAGKISTAFTPKYGEGVVDVEIMETFQSFEEARLAVPRPPTPEAKPAAAGDTVRCLETGVDFPSASAAAGAYGISPSNMSTHLRHGTPQSLRGLHFERVEGTVRPRSVRLSDVLAEAEKLFSILHADPSNAEAEAGLIRLETSLGRPIMRPHQAKRPHEPEPAVAPSAPLKDREGWEF